MGWVRTSMGKTRVLRSKHLSHSSTASFGWSRGAPVASASASQPQAVQLPSGADTSAPRAAFGGLAGTLAPVCTLPQGSAALRGRYTSGYRPPGSEEAITLERHCILPASVSLALTLALY